LAGLLLAPAGAWAQKIDEAALEITISESDAMVNIEECSDEVVPIGVKTTQVTIFNEHSSWLVEVGDGCTQTEPTNAYVTCRAGETGCCEKLSEGPMSDTDPINQGTSFDIADAFDCAGDEKTSVVVHFKVQSLDTNLANVWTGIEKTIEVDLVRPDAPGAPEVSAGETTAQISWSTVDGEDEPTYQAHAFTGDYATDLPLGSQSLSGHRASTVATDTSVTLSDLQTGVDYVAAISVFDKAGNESLPSETRAFATAEVLDFYELYRSGSGGGDPGGFCAAAPASRGGGGWWLVALLGCAALARRRRRHVTMLVLATLVLIPLAAQAESPRFMTFEFRLGNWTPQVDEEFANASRHGLDGPYERFFGADSMLLLDLEFAAHLYQEVGTLAVGVGIGRGSVTGEGFRQDGSRADEKSSFTLYPFTTFASYAFDWPAHHWGFPLVPYAKLGVDWVIWDITDGSDDTAKTSDPKGEGSGATWGWHYALGLRLLLDALSPEMARTFDLDMGVNNSYLFIEYLSATVDDFGDHDSIRLGDDAAVFGLAFDF